jgi:hypothetical protein
MMADHPEAKVTCIIGPPVELVDAPELERPLAGPGLKGLGPGL